MQVTTAPGRSGFKPQSHLYLCRSKGRPVRRAIYHFTNMLMSSKCPLGGSTLPKCPQPPSSISVTLLLLSYDWQPLCCHHYLLPADGGNVDAPSSNCTAHVQDIRTWKKKTWKQQWCLSKERRATLIGKGSWGHLGLGNPPSGHLLIWETAKSSYHRETSLERYECYGD